MPYSMPRNATQQDQYRWELREKAYASTRRVPSYEPDRSAPPTDPMAALKELAEMQRNGLLSDAEFAAAKARILDPAGGSP
jgi:hypothetical protein